MKKNPKRVGGLQRKSAPVHNIKNSTRRMRGAGPTFNAPGHTRRSLPTHVVIKPGGRTGTFAV